MPSPNLAELAATTMRQRSTEAFDNVLKNNAFLAMLKKRNRIRYITGGTEAVEVLKYAENPNAGWYSGYDPLPVTAAEQLTGATFDLKQLAAPLTISGREKLQNNGKEQALDMLEQKMDATDSTLANLLAESLYSDGTNYGGKQMPGLAAAVVANPLLGTFGGISRVDWPFWRNQASGALGAQTVATIIPNMNTLWARCVRGKDRPKLILTANTLYGTYEGSLQLLQRFTDATDSAGIGFPSLKYKDADVVLDGGIGGFCPDAVMFFINPDYLFLRPHADRNMVPLDPKSRTPVNQDADVVIQAWAGMFTASGLQFQGYFQGS
jgi:hypothetical protein